MNNEYTIQNKDKLTESIFAARCVFDLSDSRKSEVAWHVHSDDYFATLATIIGLMHQLVKDDQCTKFNSQKALSVMQNIQEELVYLQNQYVIQKRSED